MPVTIDELIVQAAPPDAEARGENRERGKQPDGAGQAHQQREFLERIALQKARTRAD